MTESDAFDVIRTKLDIREFAERRVDYRIKMTVLEAARLTASSMNTQHWRFILVQEPANLATLAEDSPTGGWVKEADFAVIVNIDPSVSSSAIDAGRVVQDMQLAAWNEGVASGVYTGIDSHKLRRDFGIPDSLSPAIVAGFGYPRRRVLGRKNRKPLAEVAFLERYGRAMDPS